MSTVPEGNPTTVQVQANTPAPNVSSAAVATALRALKDANVTPGSPGSQTGVTDPQLVSALLTLIGQGQKDSSDEVKEAAAETLSNLSMAGGPPLSNPNIHPELQEAGPSTHPHGPPLLGQHPEAAIMKDDINKQYGKPQSRRRHTQIQNGHIMGSEEWVRQRKDNHKEVERRRRGNINEGINELARIVPNGTGEKAKGAILSRSVEYIKHLMKNESHNIEKWTLEKLLMDQAMGDLQSQLEDVRRMYQEEVYRREKAEAEIDALKAELTSLKDKSGTGEKSDDPDRSAKRPRTDA
ncbi:cbf1-centromere binding factor 1 [Pyrrhoderma noxium]|uniref:Cbf1-centromere binding factor 1 n=1 Tax=Pyrrhoderma noxium TaxID=2282107 RepID=A0A286U8S6_9AGAM|nr:cbf1-centromere binding factor 1 [Pyrrhoderma noxium]